MATDRSAPRSPTQARLTLAPGHDVSVEIRGFGQATLHGFLGGLHPRLELDRRYQMTLSGGNLTESIESRVRISRRCSEVLGYRYDFEFEEIDRLRAATLKGALPLYGRRRRGRVALPRTWSTTLQDKLSRSATGWHLSELSEDGARIHCKGETGGVRTGQLLRAVFTIPTLNQEVAIWGTVVHHHDRDEGTVAGLWWRDPSNDAQREMHGLVQRFLEGRREQTEPV